MIRAEERIKKSLKEKEELLKEFMALKREEER